jgi:hypothetical protein
LWRICRTNPQPRSLSVKSRLALVLLLLCVGWSRVAGGAPAESQPAEKTPAPKSTEASYARVVRPYTGSPVLVIEYPWNIHASPSVEVQLLSDGDTDLLGSKPLCFVDAYMKGQLLLDVHSTRDRGERLAFTMKTTERGTDLEINGRRNSLSRPAVWIDCHLKTPDLMKTETRSVFCLLDSWAVDRRTLYLDLPAKYYAQPGKLRVWFLREKDTVWIQTVAWPGMPKSAESEAIVQERKPAGRKPAVEKPPAGGKGEAGVKPAPAGKAKPAAKPAARKKTGEDGQESGAGAAEDDNPFGDAKPASGAKKPAAKEN